MLYLLNKLSSQFYDLSPADFDQWRVINPEYLRKLNVSKNWYINQVVAKCRTVNSGPVVAELLYPLEHDEIVDIMSRDDFDKACLKDCIMYGPDSDNSRETSHLFQASVKVLLVEISECVSMFSIPHEVSSNVRV